MFSSDPPPAGGVLEGKDLEQVFWRVRGLMNELERDKTFWQSTNDTLSRAYEELRIARDALAESQLQVAEQQAAIVRLVAAEKERLERELALAARIQTSILPRIMDVPGLSVAACMVPATEVGGDYYEVLPVEDGAWLGIGDVAGHGLTAGLVMLMIQSAVSALCKFEPSAAPAGVLTSVNALIYDNVRRRLLQKEHATLSLLRYHRTGELTFAGGHEEIALLRAGDKECSLVGMPGPWIGGMKNIAHVIEETTVHLEKGDLFVLYTDGVTEARSRSGELYGLERLREIVARRRSDSVGELCDALVSDVRQFAHEQVDDVTVVVARHHGAAA